MLLEETKLEYEDFTEVSRKEFKAQLDAKEKEMIALREQYDRNQQIQFENNRQVLQEQQELVIALQAQFQQVLETDWRSD